jgi:hypothetical protein
MMVHPEQIVGFLKALEALNSGTNQGMNYTLTRLPIAPSLQQSLDGYFARLRGPGQPAQVKALPDMRPILRSWLFGKFGENRDEALGVFMQLLADSLNWTECYQVIAVLPSWYDCSYEDIALTTRSDDWLLHLGVSD